MPDKTPYQNFGAGLVELFRGELPSSKPKSDFLDDRTEPCVWILINTESPFQINDVIDVLRRGLPAKLVAECYVNGHCWTSVAEDS